MQNGKGDKPRNCFSEQFKNNYDDINWKMKKKKILVLPWGDEFDEKGTAWKSKAIFRNCTFEVSFSEITRFCNLMIFSNIMNGFNLLIKKNYSYRINSLEDAKFEAEEFLEDLMKALDHE